MRTFVQYIITFCSRTEAASDVISGVFVRPVVFDKSLKFHDPSLNRSGKILPKAVLIGIFDSFYLITSDHK